MPGHVTWASLPCSLSDIDHCLTSLSDYDTWEDPFDFRPERWIEQPEAPLFTFGIGHRMCVGMQLAYRELYLLFLRVLSSYEIVADGFIENHPIRGVANPRSLTTQPKNYKVKFVPRNLEALRKALEEDLKVKEKEKGKT